MVDLVLEEFNEAVSEVMVVLTGDEYMLILCLFWLRVRSGDFDI